MDSHQPCLVCGTVVASESDGFSAVGVLSYSGLTFADFLLKFGVLENENDGISSSLCVSCCHLVSDCDVWDHSLRKGLERLKRKAAAKCGKDVELVGVKKECVSFCYWIKGTAGYINKGIFLDCQWSVKTNGATFIFRGTLGNEFLLGQFWPCLSFTSLSVPSGMAPSPDFWSCVPKLRPFLSCDSKLCDDGVVR